MLRSAAVTLALTVAGGASAEAWARATPDQDAAALTARARLWMSRARPDLARASVEQLMRVSPDHPDGLAILAEIELRSGRPDAAQASLDRLRSTKPDHPGIKHVETLMRLDGPDRNKLRHARLLAKAGRTSEALAAWRAILPDGPPSGDLALEYWQLVATTPDGRVAARNGLARLAREHRDNLHYRLALAEIETSRAPVDRRALRVLVEMSRMPTFARQAQAAWRGAVMRLEAEPATVPLLREYLARDPGDTVVRERLDAVMSEIAAKGRRGGQPTDEDGLRGLALLERGELDAAEARLARSLTRHPDDPAVVGGLGLVRLRQGRHAEARLLFERAARLGGSAATKWRSLALTAEFWALLGESSEALAAGDLERAERTAIEARKLDPHEAQALVALGHVRLRRGQLAQAEKTYTDALFEDPANGSAFRGLASIHAERADPEGVDRFVAGLTPDQRAQFREPIASLRARVLKARAEQFVTAGQPDEAFELLTRAVGVDREDPWLRYRLADLYARRGDVEKGRIVLEAYLDEHPGDPQGLYALALLLSHADQDSAALSTLERIAPAERTEEHARMQRRLWVAVQVRRAELLRSAGDPEGAAKTLAAAESAVAGDAERSLSIASAWLDAGDVERARAVLETIRLEPSAPAATHLRYARLLARAGVRDDIATLLDEIAAASDLTADERSALDALRDDDAIERANALARDGHLEIALETLRASTPDARAPSPRLLAQARILRTMGRATEALDLYDRILLSDPSSEEARLDLADTLIELDELGRAREELATVLAAAPDNPRALRYLAYIEQREGRVTAAIDHLRRSIAIAAHGRDAAGMPSRLSQLRFEAAVPQSPPRPMLVPEFAAPRGIAGEAGYWAPYRRLAEMLDQATPWLSFAADWQFRSGTAGTSRLDAVELLGEWKGAVGEIGTVGLRVGYAKVDAGTLDLADTSEASEFGTVLLCQPECSSGKFRQSASGTALLAQYERDRLRVDVGASPLGFPVQRVSGGVLYTGDLGPLSYAIDVSTRPVTSTVLSYAGARDPRTGTVWGGVQASGVRLGLSYDAGGAFGLWSSLGAHRLTGRNVQTNDRLRFMLGGYWRIVNADDRVLSVGLTGMLWRFTENAGEYTFGHGGYYSPQSYQSLSLPVAFGERSTRLSYLLRFAPSISRSRFDAAPFYPTDPALQASAEARTPITGVDPHYESDSSHGSGYSAAATVEYQLRPNVFLGGRLEIERSQNFEPNRVLVYLRIALDRAAAGPVRFPPLPVTPFRDF
jgi:tetratricopeptide (TPR) repeat protein